MINLPVSIPEPHRIFLERIERLKSDNRLMGVAVGGSLLEDLMDEFSDLDLVIAVDPAKYSNVMKERLDIVASLGHLLSGFTGEHVGEPRVLICLYDKPLLHVDFKFVSLEDVSRRVEDPLILWEREGCLTEGFSRGVAKFPDPDHGWIEDRFWVWIHYVSAKIGRGELFEAVDFISFLRTTILGPLGLEQAGGRPSGVRKIEMSAPDFALKLRGTITGYDAVECLHALRACVDIYRLLRADWEKTIEISAAESRAVEYFEDIESRYGPSKIQ
jgi:hypothetical protein